MSMLTTLLPLALLLDHFLGEPPEKWHPVIAMGRAADFWEKIWRARAGRLNGSPERGLFIAGILAALCVLLSFALPAFLLVLLCAGLHQILGFAASCVLVYFCVAARSLADHAERVRRPLEEGRQDEARQALGRIVGRRTDVLDDYAQARACVESVAENCVDGVTASLFWAWAGLLLGSLPLAAALAVAHRACNTLDAMWGRRNPRWASFGCFAARLDDVLNFLPSRLALPCAAISCLFVPRTSAGGAWREGLAFHAAHESPNSAWSEAAFAGAMGLRLGGPAIYPDGPRDHPWIGTGTPKARPEHIAVTVRLMRTLAWTTAILLAVAAALVQVL